MIREDLIFSPQWRSWRNMRLLLNFVFLLIIVPLLFAHLFKNYLLTDSFLTPILLTLMTLCSSYFVYMILISPLFRFPESSISQLRHKNLSLGLLKEKDETLFVSMSPGIQPRQLTTGGPWDYGFLVITEDELRYVGDKISFPLPKNSIHEIGLGRGLPSIAESRVVVVQWGKGDGEHVACRIAPQSAFYWQHEERNLCQRLKNWQQESSPTPLGDGRDLPYFSELEGKTPREVAWTNLLNSWPFALLILMIWKFSGLASGALYAVMAPFLCLLILEVSLHATFKDTILSKSR
jgi:hypothetical protein